MVLKKVNLYPPLYIAVDMVIMKPMINYVKSFDREIRAGQGCDYHMLLSMDRTLLDMKKKDDRSEHF